MASILDISGMLISFTIYDYILHIKNNLRFRMRLNQERQNDLQPKRMEYAKQRIVELGYAVESDDTKLWFIFKGEKVVLFVYSGWHTGKSIKDGRGIDNLLKQIKN